MDIYSLSQKINFAIDQARDILLVSHQKPDADALGSLVAFNAWLLGLGKNTTLFCADQPPANLSWLADFRPLRTDLNEINKGYYDLIVVLDSGDLNYAGINDFVAALPKRPTIINIDHHFTNQKFGDINLVLPLAVSTTEILHRFFRVLKVKITPNMASALLAGIIYDTYNFTNPNTNYQALETASCLLRQGASFAKVSDSILKNKDLATLKIWGEVLIRLSYNPRLEVATTVVFTSDLPADSMDKEITEGIANFLNNLSGVKVALILQQQPDGFVKGSLRTSDDLIDVSKLAKILGGGGHQKAAGFKIKGRLAKREDGGWQVV